MIQALRDKKAQDKGAETTHSNEGANKTENQDGETKRRRYTPQPVYQVVTRARRSFNKQLKKDGAVKYDCLMLAVDQMPEVYPDKLRFELDFRAERDRLTDSKRFCKECKDLGLDATYVADHVVFEGKGVLNKVLKDGLTTTMGEDGRMFKTPLWKDTQDLYSEEVAHE